MKSLLQKKIRETKNPLYIQKKLKCLGVCLIDSRKLHYFASVIAQNPDTRPVAFTAKRVPAEFEPKQLKADALSRREDDTKHPIEGELPPGVAGSFGKKGSVDRIILANGVRRKPEWKVSCESLLLPSHKRSGCRSC